MTRKVLAFISITILLITTFLYSLQKGSLDASLSTLFHGLFVEYNDVVASIYQLRFPRIVISILAGMALSVSGVLLQVALKNNLADPGIVGISAGASLGSMLVITFFPSLYFFKHLFAFMGGVLIFICIYGLCYRRSKSPVTIVLVGVAMSMVCQSVYDVLALFQGGSGVSVSTGNVIQTWNDVYLLFIIVCIGLLVALLSSSRCNILLLDDHLITNLGIHVTNNRIFISLIAVLLASSATAIVGVVGFLGLLVPHVSRVIIGHDHRLLIPFSALVGGWLFLLADTIGRTIILPLEIPAAIIVSLLGGPLFIFLIRKVNRYG